MNSSTLEEQIADGFSDSLESIRIINDDEDDDVSHFSFVDRVVGNEGRLDICSSANLPQACHLFTFESHPDLMKARVDAIVSPATPSQCHFRLYPVERLHVWASSACNQIPLISFPISGAAPKDAKFKDRQSDINTQTYLRKETMLSIRSTSPVRTGPNWIDDEESTTTAAAAAHANLNASLHSHDSFVSAAFVPSSTPFLFSLDALSSNVSSPVSLEDFPDDLIIHIASFLNVKSLIQARLTNRRFCTILSHNEAGWSDHCCTLWKRKIHCDPVARHLLIHGSFPKTDHTTELPNVCSSTAALQAYQLSCMDGRLRHEITRQELCYDVPSTDVGFAAAAATASNVSHNGTIWSFRFKDSAGTGWTEHDPWHRGGEARQMVFLQNGTVRQLANDHSSSNQDSIDLRLPFYDTPDASGGIDIQWRYVSQPMDLPKRNDGAYIRLTVGGRDVPTYLVRRSPTGNWGFLMENCWGVFASFQLPLKQSQRTIQPPTAGFVSSSTPTAAGATVPCTRRRQKRSRSQSPTRQVRMRLRRSSNGDGIWLNVSDIESEDEDDGTNMRNNGRVQASTSRRAIGRANNVITNPQSNNINNNLGSSSADWLLGDDFSVVTSRWQWREALYYNLGAISLPDGPVAIAEIQR